MCPFECVWINKKSKLLNCTGDELSGKYHASCLRSSDPFYIISYYLYKIGHYFPFYIISYYTKLVTTSWTYSIVCTFKFRGGGGGPSDPPAGGRGENYIKKNREKGLKNACFRVINSEHFDGDLLNNQFFVCPRSSDPFYSNLLYEMGSLLLGQTLSHGSCVICLNFTAL